MSDLINASLLAAALGVAVATITAWAKKGIIPAEIHEGRLYRFDLARVKAALAERAPNLVKQSSPELPPVL